MYSFDPFPVMETEHLNLRRIAPKDLEDLFEMRTESGLIEFTDNVLDRTREETKLYMEKMHQGVSDGEFIIWAMEHKETEKVIGTISIWNIRWEEMTAELGYRIIPSYQRRGYMKEALREITDYTFEMLNLRVIEAYTEEKNIPSRRLLESLHFKETGMEDDQGINSERVYHMVIYKMKKA